MTLLICYRKAWKERRFMNSHLHIQLPKKKNKKKCNMEWNTWFSSIWVEKFFRICFSNALYLLQFYDDISSETFLWENRSIGYWKWEVPERICLTGEVYKTLAYGQKLNCCWLVGLIVKLLQVSWCTCQSPSEVNWLQLIFPVYIKEDD